MHLKAMIVGGITAVLSALFLQLLLPIILALLLAVLISGATFLDPLYASDRLDAIWGNFGQLAALQIAQTLITAVFAGIVAGEIGVRWEACLGYLLAGGASSIIHALFLPIFVLLLPLFMSGEGFGLAQTFAFMLALTMGFLIGVLSAMTARKWGVSNESSGE